MNKVSTKRIKKYPFVMLGSKPIGPIALEHLKLSHYEPLAVIDDPSLSTEEMLDIIEKAAPTWLLVVGFGAILKRPILDSVAGQVINIHPSLLPEYRGPSPVVQAILDGVAQTGVSVMVLDEKMDHGPIIAQEEYRMNGTETPDDLYKILTAKGVELLLDNIDSFLEDNLDPLPQNHFEATFCHMIKKDDGVLDLCDDVRLNERKIRAYQGWPRASINFRGKRILIDSAHIESDQLVFDKVQPENGKTMTVNELCAGLRIKPDEFYLEINS